VDTGLEVPVLGMPGPTRSTAGLTAWKRRRWGCPAPRLFDGGADGLEAAVDTGLEAPVLGIPSPARSTAGLAGLFSRDPL